MATTFLFPPLIMDEDDVKGLNFDRVCFQFSVNNNNECILVGYRMNETRGIKMTKGLIILRKDPDASEDDFVKITNKVLWVQLELTGQEISQAIGVPGKKIHFTPEKRTIDKYSYVIYHIPLLASGGDLETHPCPPAIPPGGEG